MKNLRFLYIFIPFLIVSSCVKSYDKGIIDVSPEIQAQIIPTSEEIVFHVDDHSQPIEIKNETNSRLEYKLSTQNDFLYIQYKSGVLEANEIKRIPVILNRTLISDEYTLGYVIVESGNQNTTVPIKVYHQKERKIKQDFEIGYAEFSQELNRLYFREGDVYENSRILYTYDIEEAILTETEMPFAFEKIHLLPKHNKIVLHNRSDIYVLNINNYSIDFEIDLSGTVTDIIYLDDMMYIFPHSTGYYAFQTYDYQSAELNMYGFNEDYDRSYFDAHLHPNEDYFYAYNMHYSQGNLVRYGVIQGNSSHYYSRVVEGIDKKIWLSEDGTKLFSTQNKYFEIIPDSPEFDLISHNFDLKGDGYVNNISYSANRGEYYFSMINSDHDEENTIYIYDENLNFKHQIQSEDFYFFNSSNDPYFLYDGNITHSFYSEKSDALILITYPNGSSRKSAIEVLPLNN